MPKNTHSDTKQNYKSNSQNMLKRRPIHQETEHSDENQGKKYQDNFNNSPQKSKPLYPTKEMIEMTYERDDSGEELSERNNSNHRDGNPDEADVQNVQEKRLFEKGNEVKHLSGMSGTSTSFNDNCWSYFKYVLLMLVLLLGSYYHIFLKVQEPAAELSLSEKLKNMQDIFQDQNYLTFRILEKSLKKVVNVSQEPSAPAIFTVTVNKNAIYKSHKFSHYLAENLAPRHTVLINESVSWRNNPDAIKLKIDNKIQSVAKSKDLFVVIVDNLQNVPPKGAMIFHSYCDHEAAPFKEAVFLFIVPLEEVLPKETTSKKIDGAAFRQLKNIWNYASSDEIDSLITRITVNVINIR